MIELVVVDDGSQDSSVELLQAIDDPRLRLVVQENRGAHAAINRGLDMAGGDYLAIINSDDTYDPRRIAACLAAMDADGSDLACSWIRVVDGAGRETGVKQGWRNMRPSWAQAADLTGYWSGRELHAQPDLHKLRLDHVKHSLSPQPVPADRRDAQPALRP